MSPYLFIVYSANLRNKKKATIALAFFLCYFKVWKLEREVFDKQSEAAFIIDFSNDSRKRYSLALLYSSTKGQGEWRHQL